MVRPQTQRRWCLSVIAELNENADILPFVRADRSDQKQGDLIMQAPARINFQASSPVYPAVSLANNELVGANSITFADPGPREGLRWAGSQAEIYVAPCNNENTDGLLRLVNDDGISLESSVEVLGSVDFTNHNLLSVNTIQINDPGPTEGLIFNGSGAKVVVSPLDNTNTDGYLRLINDGGISLESSVRVTNTLDMTNHNIAGVNALSINDPGPTEGLLFRNTGAKIVVSPLNGDNRDGYLRLINDGDISLESDVYVAGNMEFNNHNVTGINTITINDPGPTEGLIFEGTGAKVVVSPLDDSNRDGYLRLINDGGVSLESNVRITGDLTMETGGSIALQDQPITGVGNPGLVFSDPGPDGAIQWSGTQAQIYVAPLDNGNSDGYLRLRNDGGISLESNTRVTGDLTVEGRVESKGVLTFKSANTVRHRGVVDLLHPPGGYVRGQEWAWRYYHIRTPDTAGNSEMFRYDLTGYSYGIAQPISFTWVGYLYSGNRRLIQARAVNNHPQNGVGVSHYQGSDGHLYLKFGPIRQYYTGFVLDYMSGSTRERVQHNAGGYRVILTPNDVQL